MHVKIHLTLQRVAEEKNEQTKRNNKTQQQNIVLPSTAQLQHTNVDFLVFDCNDYTNFLSLL